MIKHRSRLASLIIGAVLLTACAEIPKESITINQAVSTGIKSMQANMEVLINERAKTQLETYNQSYTRLFNRVRDAFVMKIASTKGVDPATYQLTAAEERQLTAFFITDVERKVQTEVERQRVSALEKTRADASLINGMNDSITALLTSAAEVGIQRRETVDQLGQVTGINEISKIEDFMNTTVTSLLNKF